MIRQILQRYAPASGRAVPVDPEAIARISEQITVLNSDPYLQVADISVGIISVFDDLRYDRADMDLLSAPMRSHALRKLAPMGFKQVSGSVIENRLADVRVLMPKFHALGSSPFDAARYTPKREQDYFLLTPTQTACMLIDTYDRKEAAKRIEVLIKKHPVNLLRLSDYLERKATHADFADEIGYLMHVQREAVEGEPLSRRRALR